MVNFPKNREFLAEFFLAMKMSLFVNASGENVARRENVLSGRVNKIIPQ